MEPENPETKSLSLELKADSVGEFSATFATLNVVDHHGDVTLPGAFEAGKEVLIGGYQHDMLSLPVGKGVIRADENRAWIDGAFFLDTLPGKDTYLTVKNAGGLMEWSYIFQALQSRDGDFDTGKGMVPVRFLEKLDVWSVDPVLKGAGIGTGTDSIKSLEAKGWDETDSQIRYRVHDPADFQPGSFRRVTLKRDKPHVFADMGRRKGEQTLSIQSLSFPKDDGWTMDAAKKWVADHMDMMKGMPFLAHVELFSSEVDEFLTRVKERADVRMKEGRTLSSANVDRLGAIAESLRSAATDLEQLLKDAQPAKSDLNYAYAQFQRSLAHLSGVSV